MEIKDLLTYSLNFVLTEPHQFMKCVLFNCIYAACLISLVFLAAANIHDCRFSICVNAVNVIVEMEYSTIL